MEKRGRGRELKRKGFQKETLRSLRRFLEEKVNTLRMEKKEPWVGRDSEETGHHRWEMHSAKWGGEGWQGLEVTPDTESDKGYLHVRPRQTKGTFSSDENNFLPTSSN